MDGNMIYSNDAFARMYGYSPDEVLNQNLLIFHTTEQIPCQNIRKKLGLSSRKDHLGSHLLSLLQ